MNSLTNRTCVAGRRITEAGKFAACLGLLTSSVAAQDINLDFGLFYGSCSSAHDAAGLAGDWNALALPVSANLHDIGGAATSATVTTLVPAAELAFDNEATGGDDEALLDDGFDVGDGNALLFSGLRNGVYSVFTYAWAPDDDSYRTVVDVTGSPDPPVLVGGPWGGGYVEGGHYARHSLLVSGGTLRIDLGVASGFGTCNGVQLVLEHPEPIADFTANVTSGPAPLAVTFTSQSTGSITEWTWDFGAGPVEAGPTVTNTFNAPGSYGVSLTATGPGGTHTETKPGYITVEEPPPASLQAAFRAAVTTGIGPLTTTFQNLSTGATAYAWDFGNGAVSDMRDPGPVEFAYRVAPYTVSLTVSGGGATDTETKTSYIRVLPPSGPFFVHFAKQTPATRGEPTVAGWPRYVLTGVEADNDGFGLGQPAACSPFRTNANTFRVTLTHLQDDAARRSKAPGDFVRYPAAYTVTLQVEPSSTADYGCDYELYVPVPGSSPVVYGPAEPDAMGRFTIVVPARAPANSTWRTIQMRLLADELDEVALESAIVSIHSVAASGPATLQVGANDRVHCFFEENSNPVPILEGEQCSSARPINGTGKFAFETNGSGSASTLGCGPIVRDAWLRWTAPPGGDSYFIDTYDTQFSTLIEVYEGTCGNPLICSANPELTGAGLQFLPTAGQTYFVRVGTEGPGGVGTLSIQRLGSGLAPFLHFTHTTPWTRTADGQVSTKPGSYGQHDYFGIRLRDVNRNSAGNVGGLAMRANDALQILVRVTAPVDTYELFTKEMMVEIPIVVSGSEFTLDVPAGSQGEVVYGRFLLPSPQLPGSSHDIQLEVLEVTGPDGGGVGWNSTGKWTVYHF